MDLGDLDSKRHERRILGLQRSSDRWERNAISIVGAQQDHMAYLGASAEPEMKMRVSVPLAEGNRVSVNYAHSWGGGSLTSIITRYR